MPENGGAPRRRLGPVGFHAESKVTAQSHGPGSNHGGLGEAVGPTRETPTKTKELEVARVGVWALVGVIVVLVGVLLLQPVLIGLGLVGVVGAWLANRTNRTESRLRDEMSEEGSV